MSPMIKWRALRPCVAGGAYREAGEVFAAPDTDEYAADVRVKLGSADAGGPADGGPAAAGRGEAVPAADRPKGRGQGGKTGRKGREAPGVMPAELPYI